MGANYSERLEYFFWKHPMVRKTCRNVLVITCLPYTLCYPCLTEGWQGAKCGNGLRNIRIRKHRKMIDVKYRIRESSLRRKKSLSEGSGSSGLRTLHRSTVKTRQQSQSYLFTKLPPEIRRQIFAYVVADQPLLHVTICQFRRLTVPDCQILTEEHRDGDAEDVCAWNIWHLTCMKMFTRDGGWCGAPTYHSMDTSKSLVNILPLLTTCRRIYTETIGLLYSANTFALSIGDEGDDLINFARFIPNRHLCRVKSLILYTSVPLYPDCEEWKSALSVLQSMPGLRSCHITLCCEAQIEILQDKHSQGVLQRVESMVNHVRNLDNKEIFVVELAHVIFNRSENILKYGSVRRWNIKDMD